MLERFRSALVAPHTLIRFRRDRVIAALGYMFFFAIIMATPATVSILSYDGLGYSQQEEIRQEFTRPTASCEVENAELSCAEPIREMLYDDGAVTYHIDSHDTLDVDAFEGAGPKVVLHGESVHFFLGGIGSPLQIERPIESLHEDVHNLDFDYETQEEEDAFFTSLFNAVDNEILRYRPLWGTPIILSSLLIGIFYFNIFVLLNSFLIRRRLPMVPFRQMFVMMTYASTLLFLVLIFNTFAEYLFGGLNLILFIILLFIAFRQTSRLAFEIQKRARK